VTSVRDRRPSDSAESSRREHDLLGTDYEPAIPGLQRAAVKQLSGPAIRLDLPKAELLVSQFQETAEHRRWTLLAVAIMVNHFHVVVQVPDDPDPRRVLAGFKAYATRTLNQRFGKPPSGTWWTTNGSKRKLADGAALNAAVQYVLYKQPNPLIVWSPRLGRIA
jgi:REP element-mobilizing transposase RayT